MQVVVHDACVLLNLLKTGLLPLCATLGWQIVTSDFVAAEIRTDAAGFAAARDSGLVLVLELTGAEVREVAAAGIPPGLSLADRSVARLAERLSAPLFTSDRLLRDYAAGRKITVRGELGILDDLVAAGALAGADAAGALRAMLAAGARLPAEEAAARMRRWGQGG